MARLVGIDLGTTYSVAAIIEDGAGKGSSMRRGRLGRERGKQS